MTSFSIASIAFSNSAGVCDFHGSDSTIVSAINCRQRIQEPLLTLRKSWINLICSFTVNGFFAKLARKLLISEFYSYLTS